jgi:hypothetical protein
MIGVMILMMETASSSGTSTYFYRTARRKSPEDGHLLRIP